MSQPPASIETGTGIKSAAESVGRRRGVCADVAARFAAVAAGQAWHGIPATSSVSRFASAIRGATQQTWTGFVTPPPRARSVAAIIASATSGISADRWSNTGTTASISSECIKAFTDASYIAAKRDHSVVTSMGLTAEP